jgi:valyl-tRNA synthetase
MALEMPKNFAFLEKETEIYEKWEKSGLFKSKPTPGKKPYTIVIPPPNVTGVLHMGHALNNTLQDILIRWRRMQGYETLWQPGTDHAGIATQSVVENRLYEDEKKTRFDVGRENLIKMIWDWKEKYGGTIVGQLRRLGSSCDWSRERFTMDEGLSQSVREVFCGLYERGLIYRGSRITNRCPKLGTSLADDEIDYKTVKGNLWTFRYFTPDQKSYIDIATTRPETMLGDTAIAINKDDSRWNHLLGKTVIVPCNGREIKVIADDYVDPKFGTGAVKITPAHDPNDYEVGLRHNLEQIVIMNNDGTINENGGKYQGLNRFVCRKKLVADLKEFGHLIDIKEHENNVGHCYRTGDIVEPILSKQWFVKMKPLAEKARKATDEGKVKFHPERWEKVYLSWIDNVRDWCISRQIWWGHRIPVWYCNDCNFEIVARNNEPKKCTKCQSSNLTQDSDVLDTWFSSALWPFSTLGWPEKTKELDFYYPTSTLITDRGIIYFWVARMVMMGMEFMDKPPFSDVYIHGTILDEKGVKMSKSKGNGIDPLEMIEQYGADAIRFSLIMLTTEGQDLKLAKSRFEMGRNFTNKVWNAARFVLLSLDTCPRLENWKPDDAKLLIDRWIITKLNSVITSVSNNLELFKYNQALDTAYSFMWDDFCDWYLESVKIRVLQGDRSASSVLAYCLNNILKLLHPFVPFVTEELWQQSAAYIGSKDSIMIQTWPIPSTFNDQSAMENVEMLKEIVRITRNVKANYNVATKKEIPEISVCVASNETQKAINYNINFIKDMYFVVKV